PTATMCMPPGPSAGSVGVRHACAPMPLGTTVTVTEGAVLVISSAATVLTAVTTSGARLQSVRRSRNQYIRRLACPHMLCTVTTVGSLQLNALHTADHANGDTDPRCTCTTSGRSCRYSWTRCAPARGCTGSSHGSGATTRCTG